ncbi:MAG: hypothetical protein IJS46_04055, partial [Kiritimatiellae bacterium]|nr:hypothetical protein [Kiritimatiellia bacterium]
MTHAPTEYDETENGGEGFMPDGNPLRRSITEKFDIVIGAVVAAIFTAVHGATSLFWVFPGDSARYIATILGIEPVVAPRNQIFIAFFRLVSALGGSRYATTMASITTLAFSSLCIFMVYLLSVAVFRMLTDLDYLHFNVHKGEKWLWTAPRAAGVIAAAALGLSAPFWTASTRVNADSFYLSFILLAAYLLVRFLATDRLWTLYGASALYGVLCVQSPAALQFFPLFAALVAFGALRGDRPIPLTLAVPGAIAAVSACAVAAICIWAFTLGDGYRVMHYSGPGRVFEVFVSGMVSGAFSGFSRSHWLIIGFTTTIPFLAWLAAGKWALDGTRYVPLRFLDLAIFLASLLVLSGSRYSPWGLFGVRPEQIVASTMASMSLAYCFIACHQQALFLFNRAGAPPFPGARLFGAIARFFVAVVCVAVLSYEAGIGKTAADSRSATFLLTYIDGLLDGLDGRDLLITDPILEDIVRIRARERGVPLSVINLAASANSAGRRKLRERITDPILKNAFDLGIFPFIQEYIGHDSEAANRVALTFFPDLWNIGPYRAYPHGLAFVGIPESAPMANPLQTDSGDSMDRDVAGWRKIAAKLAPQLDAVPEDSSPLMLAIARIVRQRTSFIGNNLAYCMLTADRAQDALALWREVHAFDDSNLSATLNLYTVLEREGRTEERDAVRAELDAFRRKMTKPLQIWELSRSQGYVASPDAFASLGLSWALTGQTSLALGTLDAALRDGVNEKTVGGASPILLAMGAIHGKMGDAEAAEQAFLKVLENDPDNVHARLGLVRARLSQGEFDEMDDLID